MTHHIDDTNKMITAVEWLFLMLNNPNRDQEFANKILEGAKVMEWKQLVDAWVNGNNCEPKEVTQDYAEKYYKEVYGVEGAPDTSSPNIKNK